MAVDTLFADMVWFQCEDCGENLKKPKLPNHFHGCSAQKLSCIDCGVIFNQQSVQGHTQCVSEAEKYGPKNVGFVKKEIRKTPSKENKCDGLDLSLGLSTRGPWSCSLCNVKATSQETLLLHSEGKKHKSKVRSMSSKMSNGKDAVDSSAKEDKSTAPSNQSGSKGPCKFYNENGLREDFSQGDDRNRQLAGGIDGLQFEPDSKIEGTKNEHTVEKKKKRKLSRDHDRPPSEETRKAESFVEEGEACGKQVINKVAGPIEILEDKHMDKFSRKKCRKILSVDDVEEFWTSLVKWKKLIKRALKNAPNNSLKIKQLRSSIFPTVMEVVKRSDLDVNEATFSKELERQIQSYEKFIIDGKKVRLAV